jgi:mono/diheme cytochrome c family protein
MGIINTGSLHSADYSRQRTNMSTASICRLALGILLCLLGSDVLAKDNDAGDRYFENEIRPLLVKHCHQCHGPKKQKSGLRLDSLASALRGGENGAAVVKSKPAESLLLEAVKYESFEMPPSGKLPSEAIAKFEKWVSMGAPWPGSDADAPQPDIRKEHITDLDRAYWAFQPVQRPSLPEATKWTRNEIDRFILRRLKKESLSPAPEADRATLVRRLYFDLVGLPPSPVAVQDFVNDTSADAYEKLVDQLLASPHYGEHWGRHWLDLVRYAESDGFRADAYRSAAYKYRDYVIKSLNDDKSYVQFVREQLAGDEIDPGNPNALTATMFLRHWIYEHNQRDVEGQWQDILNDLTNVTSDVFLGMGMGCARCHDHKFDPILQKDYFRLQAFFRPLLPRENQPLAALEVRQEHHRQFKSWADKTDAIRKELHTIESPILLNKAGGEGFSKFVPVIKAMMVKRTEERGPYEHQIASMAAKQLKFDRKVLDKELKGDVRKRWEELHQMLKAHDATKPKPLPTVPFAVSDVGPLSPVTKVPGPRGEVVEPGFLTVLHKGNAAITPPDESLQSTGRRTALANWITSPENPLTTRVITNRIWQYHFGRGIVPTSSDLGRLGEKPTHPELLDWLTSEFIRGEWRFKHLHKVIVMSATYRQRSYFDYPSQAVVKDPQNTLLWRMNSRRLQAEQVRDASLLISGELNTNRGGASVASSEPRRSVYTKQLRNSPDSVLAAFDAPDGYSSISERSVTTTSPQALLLINGNYVLSRAKAFAKRIQKEADGPRERIERAYEIAYGRKATAKEVDAAAEFLETQPDNIPEHTIEIDPKRWAAIPNRDGNAAQITKSDEKLQIGTLKNAKGDDFTVEAVIVLKSIFPDASVRTIASAWNGNTSSLGWSLGVTSEKSAYQPRNLIAQVIGDTGQGAPKYEVIASDLRPELNKPYYVAVSIDFDGAGQGIATFYMKDLSRKNAPLISSKAKHPFKRFELPSASVVVGGRDHQKPNHHWDGLIDDVRISKTALPESALLIAESFANKKQPRASEETLALWDFESANRLHDATPNQNHLFAATESTPPQDREVSSLIDFCHVLLNSSEFLYVD